MALLLRSLGAEVHGFSLPPEHANGIFSSSLALRPTSITDRRYPRPRSVAGVDREARAGDRDPYGRASAGPPVLCRADRDLCDQRDGNRQPAGGGAAAYPGSGRLSVVTSDKCYENTGSRTAVPRRRPRWAATIPTAAAKAARRLSRPPIATVSFTATASCPDRNCARRQCDRRRRLGRQIGWCPDMMRAFMQGEAVQIRNPDAIRPWQHVMDPLDRISGAVRGAVRGARNLPRAGISDHPPAAISRLRRLPTRLPKIGGRTPNGKYARMTSSTKRRSCSSIVQRPSAASNGGR